MRMWVLLVGFIVVFSFKTYGQTTNFTDTKLKIGASIGYGIPIVYESEEINRGRDRLRRFKYEYWPVLYQVELQKLWQLKRKGLYLGYLIQPQLNFAHFKSNYRELGYKKSVEAGVNANIVFGFNFFNKNPKKYLLTYAFLGSGPHYISASPDRQSSGFIFSDNLGMGSQISVNNSLLIDLKLGIRHLSNASIKRPNAGINNMIFNIGFKKAL